MEDRFLMDAGSYDEDSAAVELQGRAMRSPRRCIPNQQSCLGYPLPCCDPCDTCYCRFFNANCYCRRVGRACSARRT
ncbi:Agouti-related protein [Liparis tanakae]|uniref:Agouti-related protein n=1 Tax=Liparis tanakae TaxID=230148 RepID=A0A4Z2ESI5_9TELE|nr:Agouti-related protein [Liparis tanakae]